MELNQNIEEIRDNLMKEQGSYSELNYKIFIGNKNYQDFQDLINEIELNYAGEYEILKLVMERDAFDYIDYIIKIKEFYS